MHKGPWGLNGASEFESGLFTNALLTLALESSLELYCIEGSFAYVMRPLSVMCECLSFGNC